LFELSLDLGSGYVDSTRTFVRILCFKGDFIVHFELVEGNTFKRCVVEEDVVSAIFRNDETKSFVCKSFDFSSHNNRK